MHPLMQEITLGLVERLQWIRRSFAVACNLGSPPALVREAFQQSRIPSPYWVHTRETILCDEEFLPFAPDTFDLILSIGGLHWVNDLPGTLRQICASLKPDGLFLGILVGGNSLSILRESFYRAELALRGEVTPRVSPMVKGEDAATLLQRAGFALPVVDRTVHNLHTDPLGLMEELKKCGQANGLKERSKALVSPALLKQAIHHYKKALEREGEGGEVLEILTLTGWKPSPQQPVALPRGSAQRRLLEALETK